MTTAKTPVRPLSEDSVFEGFVEAAKGLKEDTPIVITQIDPDALASAFALRYILRQIGSQSGFAKDRPIVYCGAIGHPQNRAIINFCGLEMISIYGLDTLGEVILVDSSSVNDRRVLEKFRPLKPLIVIDHHKADLPQEIPFVWLEEIGAASTLIVELAEHLDIALNSIGTKVVESLSLLLALGIYTDTKLLGGASQRDLKAYGKMMNLTDTESFVRLVKYPLPPSYFEHLRYALESRVMKDATMVASVGTLSLEDGDDISTIADHLIRQDGVSLVLAWAIVENMVRISARSTNIGRDLREWLAERFGRESSGAKFTPDGIGEGGAVMNLELGWLAGEKTSTQTKQLIEELVAQKIKERVFGS